MARRELSPACLQVVQACVAMAARVGWPEGAGRVVVGCSGGADSLALAAGLAHLATRDDRLATRLRGHVVDHRLQLGSAAVAARVVEQLATLGVTAEVSTVQVVDSAAAGMEAAARQARYAALLGACGPSGQLWLGHTLDDQAESVLLGLARGSGTRSLAGMAPVRERAGIRMVRPLLGLRRSVTAQACTDWGLEAWQDPHNADPRFVRVRVRDRILPLLEAELGPGVTEALARTADLARADADELDARAASLLPDPGTPIAVSLLSGLPAALSGRVLRRWLVSGGVPEPTMAHVRAVAALVTEWHGQAGVDLPGGHRVRRVDGLLVLGGGHDVR